jgi:hypothetical protein
MTITKRRREEEKIDYFSSDYVATQHKALMGNMLRDGEPQKIDCRRVSF